MHGTIHGNDRVMQRMSNAKRRKQRGVKPGGTKANTNLVDSVRKPFTLHSIQDTEWGIDGCKNPKHYETGTSQ